MSPDYAFLWQTTEPCNLSLELLFSNSRAFVISPTRYRRICCKLASPRRRRIQARLGNLSRLLALHQMGLEGSDSTRPANVALAVWTCGWGHRRRCHLMTHALLAQKPNGRHSCARFLVPTAAFSMLAS